MPYFQALTSERFGEISRSKPGLQQLQTRSAGHGIFLQ